MNNNQVIIIGAGLAGLTAAIHLSKARIGVTLIEKHAFPRHKVCGEYVSNEVLPYLQSIGADPAVLNPTQISRTEFSSVNGKTIKSQLPLGGFGVSRYQFDNFLLEKALDNGCQLLTQTVTDVSFASEKFEITLADGQKLSAEMVIGAFGKRSNIDQKLSRSFLQRKSPWLAVKAHYSGDFPDDLVALHNFSGGYCGVSKVENNRINICYLADYESFKKHRNITDFERHVVCKNPNLKALFDNSTMLFEKPLTISQISFENKRSVDSHLMMAGDSAGLINPLCGNGMAIAIHSSKIASELLIAYFDGEISRELVEKRYESEWNLQFRSRIRTGRLLAGLLQRQPLSNIALAGLTTFPFLMPQIIRKTHGQPIHVSL